MSLIPCGRHRNHDSIWNLSRLALSIALKCKRLLYRSEHYGIFKIWFNANRKNLNPNQTEEDYFEEYLEAARDAKKPFEESSVELAACLAKEANHPENLDKLPSQELSLLAAMCFHLQAINNNEGKFFLGLKDVVSYLFPDITLQTASRRLKALYQNYKVIERTSIGSSGRGKASEFLWVGKVHLSKDEAVPCHL